MKNTVGFIRLTMILTLSLGTLSSCVVTNSNSNNKNSGVESNKEKFGDVSVYSFYKPHFDNKSNATGMAAIQYKNLYGSNVNVQVLPYANYASTLLQTIAAGSQPDIASVYWGDMPNWCVNILQPVDDYIDLSKQNHQGIIESYAFNNRHFTLSVQQVQVPLLWFNKSIFERYGIEKNPYDLWKENNWNWNTFRKLAKELTQDTDGDGETNLWGFSTNDPQVFHNSNSAPMISTTGDKASLVWDSVASINAFKFMQTLLNVDKSMNPNGEIVHSGAFENDQIAMAYGTFEFAFFRSAGMDLEMLGVAPFPTGPDFDGSYLVCTNFFGLVQGAKNPKGAGKLCELITEGEKTFPMGFDLGNSDATDILRNDQKEVIQFATNKAKISMDRGWGNFIVTFGNVFGAISVNQNILTELDSTSPVARAEIDDTLAKLKELYK